MSDYEEGYTEQDYYDVYDKYDIYVDDYEDGYYYEEDVEEP